MARITFLPDDTEVETSPGETILQASLRTGLSHAHACGGKARCTTCRVWVLEGLEHCEPRNEREQGWAEQLRLDARVRLACQTTVTGEMKLRRLILDEADLEIMNQLSQDRPAMEGNEAHLAILFSDIRGFTTFSEPLPAYDVLFVLNRYFHQMGQAIERYGGQINNYMGDGLMALFGVDDPSDAPLRAVRAGLAMLEAMEELKPYLAATYDQDLEMGIGIHYGPVVLGTMGYAQSRRLSTIGDSVNLASRVESSNKEAGTHLLISDDTYKEVSDAVSIGKRINIDLKGKSGKHALYEVTGLTAAAGIADPAGELAIRTEDGQQWVRVLAQQDLPANRREVVRVGSLKVLLVNHQDRILAFEDRCPHLRLPLKPAKITDDFSLVCAWHHSTFDLNTGNVEAWSPWPALMGPTLAFLRRNSKRSLQMWPTRLQDGYIWVGMEEQDLAVK
ncbi:MAG: hypothetical protein CL878_08905 [Dehalococcoidia bacterium]|nr:hypothetical protein [Dehalococcoidia bacterium]